MRLTWAWGVAAALAPMVAAAKPEHHRSLQAEASVSVAFGGSQPGPQLRFGAQLVAPRIAFTQFEAESARGPALLVLEVVPASVLTMRLAGAEIAGFSWPRENGPQHGLAVAGEARTGGWLSRNWWVVGLGAATATLAAAVISTGGDSNDPGAPPSTQGGVNCEQDGSCLLPCDAAEPVTSCNGGAGWAEHPGTTAWQERAPAWVEPGLEGLQPVSR